MKKTSIRGRLLPRTEFGDPILTRKSKRVPKRYLGTREFEQLRKDLIRTMRLTKGVGLAAPQVGIPLRIAVLEVRSTPERPELTTEPLTLMVNPEILAYEGKPTLKWEGCLSFNKAFGRVPRYPRVRVRYMNEDGDTITELAGGLRGHIFQHEIDHLEGIRYIDRMESPESLVTAAAYRRQQAKKRRR